MIAQEHKILNKLVPLIRIIKDRESIYFEALSFANKNIQSSFNDYDQISIFGKFLKIATEEESKLAQEEEQLLRQLGSRQEYDSQSLKLNNNSKQMMRLYARALQLIDEAVERASKSLFNDNGQLSINYSRFKKALHKIVKQNPIDLYDFSALFINFCKSKYRKQIGRLKVYLNRLQGGEQVSLRDMFTAIEKQKSDASSSPEQKMKLKSIKKLSKKPSQKQQTSQTESPNRKQSTRKVLQTGSKTKKHLNPRSIKKEQKKEENQEQKNLKQKKSKKQRNARKLYNYYAIMELNKKQFLQDYIFEKHEEDDKRKKLMAFLMEKNKFNDEQIRQFHSKYQNDKPMLHTLPNPSSDENQASMSHHNQSSVASRISMRTSFVISKRKPSFTFQSPSERSEGQNIKNQHPLSKTIRNFSTRKANSSNPSPVQNSRPKQQQNSRRSKKIFVVKSPMIFEDDVIPKAQITNTTQWIQQPLTGPRDGRPTRRSDPLRLKKRNNPCPLDSNFLPQSFQFTQYPA